MRGGAPGGRGQARGVRNPPAGAKSDVALEPKKNLPHKFRAPTLSRARTRCDRFSMQVAARLHSGNRTSRGWRHQRAVALWFGSRFLAQDSRASPANFVVHGERQSQIKARDEGGGNGRVRSGKPAFDRAAAERGCVRAQTQFCLQSFDFCLFRFALTQPRRAASLLAIQDNSLGSASIPPHRGPGRERWRGCLKFYTGARTHRFAVSRRTPLRAHARARFSLPRDWVLALSPPTHPLSCALLSAPCADLFVFPP